MKTRILTLLLGASLLLGCSDKQAAAPTNNAENLAISWSMDSMMERGISIPFELPRRNAQSITHIHPSDPGYTRSSRAWSAAKAAPMGDVAPGKWKLYTFLGSDMNVQDSFRVNKDKSRHMIAYFRAFWHLNDLPDDIAYVAIQVDRESMVEGHRSDLSSWAYGDMAFRSNHSLLAHGAYASRGDLAQREKQYYTNERYGSRKLGHEYYYYMPFNEPDYYDFYKYIKPYWLASTPKERHRSVMFKNASLPVMLLVDPDGNLREFFGRYTYSGRFDTSVLASLLKATNQPLKDYVWPEDTPYTRDKNFWRGDEYNFQLITYRLQSNQSDRTERQFFRMMGEVAQDLQTMDPNKKVRCGGLGCNQKRTD